MDRYTQLKRFHHERRLQVYMYDFMYIGPRKMQVEDHHPFKKSIFVNHEKMSTQGSVPKIVLDLVI